MRLLILFALCSTQAGASVNGVLGCFQKAHASSDASGTVCARQSRTTRFITTTRGRMSDLFAKSEPTVEKTYAAILKAVSKFGPVKADAKKTSIHLVAKTGFAGVHPRKSAILLNIRSTAPIKSKRIRKVEQVSANRYHNEMLLAAPSEVDAEVVGWLKAAHALSIG